MKAIILIEIDENHVFKEANDLYDRLQGYECELRPMPKREKPNSKVTGEFKMIDKAWTQGYNACLAEITGGCEEESGE